MRLRGFVGSRAAALVFAAVGTLALSCSSGSPPDTEPLPNPVDPPDTGTAVENRRDAATDGVPGIDGEAAPICGRLMTLCKGGDPCVGAPDCESKVCFDGTCRVPVPSDGVKNNDETDVDCGGSKAPACADSKECLSKSDCSSGVCTTKTCQVATPADGVQNGDETGVDCGGTKAPKCPAGRGCLATTDCDNVKCDVVQKKCLPASHTDEIKNDSETGVDCGGPAPAKCPTGEGCLATADCNAVACDVGVTNRCLPPTHEDGIKNLGETGIDCGGDAPTKCTTGQGCAATTDCDAVLCDVAGTRLCLPPTHTDRIKNLGETGIDCGGAALPALCPSGQGCLINADCNNVLCNVGTLVCDPPTSTDALKNGTETDIDCGGGAPTNAIGCEERRVCAVDGDCASTFCNGGRCVAGRSCKTGTTSGITTCGKRESGDGSREHESCCRSLPLPNIGGVKLDKYEVTAGRMRQFITSVGPNLRQWVANEIAGNTPTGLRLAADLPATMRDLLPRSATPSDPLNLLVQIGMTVMDPRVPSRDQGCYNGADAYGANTYWWPTATLRSYFGTTFPGRRFTQQQYDEKSMNSAPYWIYASFCAWDGGRMPTTTEMNDAWGTTVYPWNVDTYPFPLGPGGGPYQYEQTANYFNNRDTASLPGLFYHFPNYGDGADVAGYLAAPGRFILDATSRTSPGVGDGERWMDLGANLMELTKAGSGNVTFCDWSVYNPGAGDVRDPACTDPDNPGVLGVKRATGLPNSTWVGGSWEGHSKFSLTEQPGQPFFRKNSYNLNTHTQYGKTGVRCAR